MRDLDVPEITVAELSARLADESRPRPVLLDVRRPGEHALCALEGSLLAPLHELPDRAGELSQLVGREVVVYCHHGVRSLGGAAILRDLGVDAVSLQGGIDAWSREIDPRVPRY